MCTRRLLLSYKELRSTAWLHTLKSPHSRIQLLIGNELEDDVIGCEKDELLSEKWHQKTERDNQRRTTRHNIVSKLRHQSMLKTTTMTAEHI